MYEKLLLETNMLLIFNFNLKDGKINFILHFQIWHFSGLVLSKIQGNIFCLSIHLVRIPGLKSNIKNRFAYLDGNSPCRERHTGRENS